MKKPHETVNTAATVVLAAVAVAQFFLALAIGVATLCLLACQVFAG